MALSHSDFTKQNMPKTKNVKKKLQIPMKKKYRFDQTNNIRFFSCIN